MIRIGHGYDVHAFAEGRRLVLGGVEIPFEKGLLGHSDADVLLHAICDAMLGAAALGDIGGHFPDSDERYHNIDSRLLLLYTYELLQKNGWRVVNIDCTVIAQAPKLMPYIEQMRTNIADTLYINISEVSVKATTEERLGFTGAMQGIAAHSVCLIEKI